MPRFEKGNQAARKHQPTEAPAVFEAPAEVPVFDPEMLACETYGDGGKGFIQGKNYFTAAGKFVRELPKEQWYICTPEMERNNKIARSRWKAKTHQHGPVAAGANIPDKLLQISRENARVSAAESLSE